MPDDTSCIPNHRFVCWDTDSVLAKDSYADRRQWKYLCDRACVHIKHTHQQSGRYIKCRRAHIYSRQEKRRECTLWEIVKRNRIEGPPIFSSFCASANLCLKPPLWCYNPRQSSCQWLTVSAQNKALHHPSTPPSTHFLCPFISLPLLSLSRCPSFSFWCAVLEYQRS